MTSSVPSNDTCPADRERAAHDVLRFAHERLGPACVELLADAARQACVLSRMRHGFALEDAVLAEVHREAATNRRVADEFLAYFLRDLLRLGQRARSADLKRFLDSGDLVQSVLGDLWPELCELEFETRGRFLAYLARRIGWKAADRSRALRAGNRREDRRSEAAPEELPASPDDAAGPLEAAIQREEAQKLWLRIFRLAERDRSILMLHLKGRAAAEIAAELGLTEEAARKALQRALHRARKLP